jgi:hypothetical protein
LGGSDWQGYGSSQPGKKHVRFHLILQAECGGACNPKPIGAKISSKPKNGGGMIHVAENLCSEGEDLNSNFSIAKTQKQK